MANSIRNFRHFKINETYLNLLIYVIGLKVYVFGFSLFPFYKKMHAMIAFAMANLTYRISQRLTLF
jgi:hypothetical protein